MVAPLRQATLPERRAALAQPSDLSEILLLPGAEASNDPVRTKPASQPDAGEQQRVEERIEQQVVSRNFHGIRQRRNCQLRACHTNQNQTGRQAAGGDTAALTDQHYRHCRARSEKTGQKPRAAPVKQDPLEIAPAGKRLAFGIWSEARRSVEIAHCRSLSAGLVQRHAQ